MAGLSLKVIVKVVQANWRRRFSSAPGLAHATVARHCQTSVAICVWVRSRHGCQTRNHAQLSLSLLSLFSRCHFHLQLAA